MKKIVASILLVSILLIYGCSCSTAPVLYFGNAWNGGEAGAFGSFEEQIYKVEYSESFTSGGDSAQFSFKKDDSINQAVTFSFENGLYKTRLDVINIDADFENKDSDIIGGDNSITLMKLETEFTITAKYSCTEQPYNDFIKTKTVFCCSNNAFSPIYSWTENCSSILSVNGTNASTALTHTSTKIYYNKNSYTVYKNTYDGASNTVVDSSTESFNYSYCSLVDNTQLLFALRNISLEKNNSYNISTVSPTYGKAQTLTVNYYEDPQETLTIKENGVEKSPQLFMKSYSFAISSSASSCFGSANKNTGKSQLVFISNSTENIANRSYVVKYVEPLTAYDSFVSMGALVYTLQEANFSA